MIQVMKWSCRLFSLGRPPASSEHFLLFRRVAKETRSQIGPKSSRFGTDLGPIFRQVHGGRTNDRHGRCESVESAFHTRDLTRRMHDLSDEMVMTPLLPRAPPSVLRAFPALSPRRRRDMGFVHETWLRRTSVN